MRKDRSRALRAGKKISRLTDGSGEYERVEIKINDTAKGRVRKITSIYFITAIMLVLTLTLILLSGSVGGYALSNNSFFGRGAEKAIRFFTNGEFLSLSFSDKENNVTDGGDTSGSENTENDAGYIEGEQNKPDTQLPSDKPASKPSLTKDMLYAFDYSMVPDGETAIVPMDLSLISYGPEYINNSTGYTPDTVKLLASELKDTVDIEYLASTNSPLVLIVHTHATEAYSEEGAISYYDDGGEYARDSDINNNVVSVGTVLADELNKLGINTLHSTVLHDASQYKDSYARSEETIRAYLEKYPSIRLVIDLHRDAIVKSSGSLVRPVTISGGESAAQVMCVVGSDWGGESCENWEGNLALALKLREALNAKTEGLCRPPYLRSSTYNQELAPYSLLLEMGASGNSLEEVKRSALLVAEALSGIIREL